MTGQWRVRDDLDQISRLLLGGMDMIPGLGDVINEEGVELNAILVKCSSVV